MTTVARPTSRRAPRWYTPSGDPCYEIIGKTTGKPRPVNLGDARKQGLLPSVTTILNVLAKPDLEAWKIEQAVLAVLTTPRAAGEQDDAFVHRVLHVEKVQDQERDTAAERGSEIHDALEKYFTGQEVAPALLPWIEPAAKKVLTYGNQVATECILVGPGYAGRTDLILEAPDCFWMCDWKATKTLPPKAAWDEHVLQAAAYAKAWSVMYKGAASGSVVLKQIRTFNCYISTVEQGKFVVWEHGDWTETYVNGWQNVLDLWYYLNHYNPPPAQ